MRLGIQFETDDGQIFDLQIVENHFIATLQKCEDFSQGAHGEKVKRTRKLVEELRILWEENDHGKWRNMEQNASQNRHNENSLRE